jgi:hypothetical protein
MPKTAAHLVDHVIRHVPVRQWALSLLVPPRLLLAAQSESVTPVLQVLRFSRARSFTTTETGSASYANAPETYRIRYQRAIGATLETLLAQPSNRSKSACWNLQFTSSAGATTQLAMAYCR